MSIRDLTRADLTHKVDFDLPPALEDSLERKSSLVLSNRERRDSYVSYVNSLCVLLGHCNVPAVLIPAQSYAKYLPRGTDVPSSSLCTGVKVEVQKLAQEFALLCRDVLEMAELHQEYLRKRNELFLDDDELSAGSSARKSAINAPSATRKFSDGNSDGGQCDDGYVDEDEDEDDDDDIRKKRKSLLVNDSQSITDTFSDFSKTPGRSSRPSIELSVYDPAHHHQPSSKGRIPARSRLGNAKRVEGDHRTEDAHPRKGERQSMTSILNGEKRLVFNAGARKTSVAVVAGAKGRSSSVEGRPSAGLTFQTRPSMSSELGEFKNEFGAMYEHLRDARNARSKRLAEVHTLRIFSEDGFLLDESPIPLKTGEFCQNILLFLQKHGMDASELSKFFGSDTGISGVEDLFWFFQCRFFVENTFMHQHELLYRFSYKYMDVYGSIAEKKKQLFCEYVPFVLGFVIVRMFHATFPHSHHVFPEIFEFAVFKICVLLILGESMPISALYRIRFHLFHEQMMPEHVLRTLAQSQSKCVFRDVVHQIIRPYPEELPNPYEFVGDILRFSDFDRVSVLKSEKEEADWDYVSAGLSPFDRTDESRSDELSLLRSDNPDSPVIKKRVFRTKSEENLFFLGYVQDDKNRYTRVSPVLHEDPKRPLLFLVDEENTSQNRRRKKLLLDEEDTIEKVKDKFRRFLHTNYDDMPRLRCVVMERTRKDVDIDRNTPLVSFFLKEIRVREMREHRAGVRSKSSLGFMEKKSLPRLHDHEEEEEAEDVMLNGESLFITGVPEKTPIADPARRRAAQICLQKMEALDEIFRDFSVIRRILSDGFDASALDYDASAAAASAGSLPKLSDLPRKHDRRSCSPIAAHRVLKMHISSDYVGRMKDMDNSSKSHVTSLQQFDEYHKTFKVAMNEMRLSEAADLRVHKKRYDRLLGRFKSDNQMVRKKAEEYTRIRLKKKDDEIRHRNAVLKAGRTGTRSGQDLTSRRLSGVNLEQLNATRSTSGSYRDPQPQENDMDDSDDELLKSLRSERQKKEFYKQQLAVRMNKFVFSGGVPDFDKNHDTLLEIREQVRASLPDTVRSQMRKKPSGYADSTGDVTPLSTQRTARSHFRFPVP
eukprot:ANDGO_00145.mRNA.1 hypothetical protein